MAPPLPPVARIANKLSLFLGGLPVGMILSFMMASGWRRLATADFVIATTNGLGLSLAVAKALGLVKARVVLLVMGLLPKKPSLIQRLLFPPLLRRLRLVTISRGEQRALRKQLPSQRIYYVPFGVDHNYWTPHDRGRGNYALAIGNDANRDWATLIRAWEPDFPQLKIITSMPVPSAPPNVEVIRGDWRTSILTDAQIRTLYRGARFVVVPVRDTLQPSGQSSCLQAMSCGCPVIMSRIEGLWDADLMRHETNVLLVEPHSAPDMSAAVRTLMEDPDLCERMALEARKLIVGHFNTDIMAAELAAHICGPS